MDEHAFILSFLIHPRYTILRVNQPEVNEEPTLAENEEPRETAYLPIVGASLPELSFDAGARHK